jgi:hypothetical protein
LQFLRAYYNPLQVLLGLRGADVSFVIGTRVLRGVRIPEIDCLIALLEPEHVAAAGKLEDVSLSANDYLGNDGVLVRLGPSWNVANMGLEPRLRSREVL